MGYLPVKTIKHSFHNPQNEGFIFGWKKNQFYRYKSLDAEMEFLAECLNK
jgi:hypothetical protein